MPSHLCGEEFAHGSVAVSCVKGLEAPEDSLRGFPSRICATVHVKLPGCSGRVSGHLGYRPELLLCCSKEMKKEKSLKTQATKEKGLKPGPISIAKWLYSALGRLKMNASWKVLQSSQPSLPCSSSQISRLGILFTIAAQVMTLYSHIIDSSSCSAFPVWSFGPLSRKVQPCRFQKLCVWLPYVFWLLS